MVEEPVGLDQKNLHIGFASRNGVRSLDFHEFLTPNIVIPHSDDDGATVVLRSYRVDSARGDCDSAAAPISSSRSHRAGATRPAPDRSGS